jgi:heme/copper-type cytochrome/quinol oxidase subunit 4
VTSLLRQRAVPVWSALVLVTCVSWWLGTNHGTSDHKLATIVIMVVAFTKIRFVGMYFMELRAAPRPLKLIFQGWCVGVCAIVLGMYLAGG